MADKVIINRSTNEVLRVKQGQQGSPSTVPGPQGPPGVVDSDPTGVTGASIINNMLAISQDDYDNIVTPDASTLYIIVEE